MRQFSKQGRCVCSVLPLVFLFFCIPANAALDPVLQAKIRATTFEVVVPKPTEDPLTYEKPLPLELLPYDQRTDKYHSIGTAFSLGGGRYVTAAHVLQFCFGGVLGPPALRDNGGNVYTIAQIYKYSQHQDFAVFTLAKEPSGVTSLPVNTKPVLNEQVYAVGNALGTGVVIRDGTYTSDTSEQQNGRWKWLRFSAPTSPGNSGGPLLNKSGEVIGLVLMKSPNENLNYALGINEVLIAPENEARIAQRMEFRLAILDAIGTNEFTQQFALPLNFLEFEHKYLNLYEEFESQELQALLRKEAAELFPAGNGSNELLHRFYRRSYPGLVYRNQNGIWRIGAETKPEEIDLPHNGRIMYGTMNHLLFFNIHMQQLHDDPSRLGALLLKALPLTRPVSEQKIRITAFGKPLRDETFDDRWGRHWQLHAWPLPFENAVFVAASSATPDGGIAFGRLIPAWKAGADARELKKLADFVYFAYSGTLLQWQKFFTDRTERPELFAEIEMKAEYGDKFTYRSTQLNFTFTQELQKIEPESVLWLYTGVVPIPAQDRAAFDIAALSLQATRAEDAGIDAYRYTPPGESLAADDQDRWKNMLEKKHPYDAVAFLQGNEKIVRTSMHEASVSGTPTVVYAVATWAPNNASDELLERRLDMLAKGMHITEH